MSNQTTIKSYKLKNNETRYMFQLYIGVDSLTGKPQTTTRRGFKSLKEAKDAFAELKVQIKNRTSKKQTIETYQDIYVIWIEHYENTVQDSTFLKTLRIFENHILPTMSHYKIDKIDVATCQKHVDQWAKKLNGFMMVKAYAAKVMKFAIKRGFIDKNPFDLVEIPIVKKQFQLRKKMMRTFIQGNNSWNYYIVLSKKVIYDAMLSFIYFRIRVCIKAKDLGYCGKILTL